MGGWVRDGWVGEGECVGEGEGVGEREHEETGVTPTHPPSPTPSMSIQRTVK
jgi:hypothetical protein